MIQADVKMNSGTDADLWVRYTDSNQGYRIRLDSSGNITLKGLSTGAFSAVASVVPRH